jgi:hypothetical protein
MCLMCVKLRGARECDILTRRWTSRQVRDSISERIGLSSCLSFDKAKNSANVRCTRQSCRRFGQRLSSWVWVSFFYVLSTRLIACVDFVVCSCGEHGRFPYALHGNAPVVRVPSWAYALFAGCHLREQNVNLTHRVCSRMKCGYLLRTFEAASRTEIRMISVRTWRQTEL